jgi:hypothetical protein
MKSYSLVKITKKVFISNVSNLNSIMLKNPKICYLETDFPSEKRTEWHYRFMVKSTKSEVQSKMKGGISPR